MVMFTVEPMDIARRVATTSSWDLPITLLPFTSSSLKRPEKLKRISV